MAGLLQAKGDDAQLCRFFRTIEEEPRDLLGPTHQRLVMHCLSEVEPPKEGSTFVPLRTALEDQLSQWLLFECRFTRSSRLACEMECPQQVLYKALQQAPEDARPIILGSLNRRPAVSSAIMEQATSWLEDGISGRLSLAILRMLGHQHEALSDRTLQAIAARLEDEDWHVRRAAVEALCGRSELPVDVLTQYIRPFYRNLLEKGFEEHLGWYIVGGTHHLAVGLREVPLKGRQDGLKDVIWEVQRDLGIPLPNDLGI